MKAEDRQLAAIVLADVEGYSRLMGADEAGTLAALTAHRREFIDATIAGHGGRIVKTTGDGFLLVFGSVVDAGRCAIAIQQGMARRNAGIDEMRRILFRMGVNIGDVIVQKGDIFGDGVNVTARLEKQSEAGGICLSRAAYEQVRDVIKVPFLDLGAQVVKNIARPVDMFGISAATIVSMDALEPTSPASRPIWRRPLLALPPLAAALALVVGVGVFAMRRPPPDLKQQLQSVLATALPNSTMKTRDRLIENYMTRPFHRVFLLAPAAKSHWYTGEWSTPEEAQEKGLERCQSFFGEPCAVIAVDGDMLPKGLDGSWPVRDMPKTHYAGAFNPDWIPGLRSSTQKRSDVVNYAATPGPKAVAYHVRGLLFIVTGAATQAQAEARALKTCNDDPGHRDVDGPCILYAVGDRVVLTERRTTPFTAP